MFFSHLRTYNPHLLPIDLLQYAQIIIDRIVFVSVIKDYDLIAYDVLKRIEKIAEESWASDGMELWRQVKTFFTALDKGLPPRIHQFNGGLFRENKGIEALVIKDEMLRKLFTLNNYDFASDLNINILGHIFEQSISDIELLKREIAEDNTQPTEEKKVTSKQRKKEGIFYTPEKITAYMVELSVGAWLNQKKMALGISQIENFPTSPKERAYHISLWEAYQAVLQEIKILDPACGSGAFLTQAFDYLLKEWQISLESISKLKGELPQSNGSLLLEKSTHIQQLSKIKKEIVSRNLYGVDLNLESVEIAKLGLWLKSASKNESLALLDSNIKRGNALITDKQVSSLAFDWEKEFATIMANGGFDVIITNPPYLVIKGGRFLEGYQYADAEIAYIKQHYQTAQQQINTYIIFVEKALSLLQDKAFASFIIPNTFLANEYAQKFRDFLLENTQVIDINNLGLAFDDANVETLILTLRKNRTNDLSNSQNSVRVQWLGKEIWTNLHEVAQLTSDKKFLISIDAESLSIIKKINQFPSLATFAKVWRGLTTGDDKQYLSTKPLNEKYKKVLSGKEIQRYYHEPHQFYVYYDKDLLDRAREEKIFLQKEKLISKFVGDELTFCYDDQQHYVLNTACILELIDASIDIKYLLALLNSTLLNFYFQKVFTDYRETFPVMKSSNIALLPIPPASLARQKPLVDQVNQMLQLQKEMKNTQKNFTDLLSSELKMTHFSKQTKDWFQTDWSTFSEELKKAKVNLSISKANEWKQFFADEKTKYKSLLVK